MIHQLCQLNYFSILVIGNNPAYLIIPKFTHMLSPSLLKLIEIHTVIIIIILTKQLVRGLCFLATTLSPPLLYLLSPLTYFSHYYFILIITLLLYLWTKLVTIFFKQNQTIKILFLNLWISL